VFYVTSKETPIGVVSHHLDEPPYKQTI